MEITKNTKEGTKLTDFQTFWKIITLVCVSIIAEALIIWAATSDLAVDWTYTTVVAKRTPAQAEVLSDEEVDMMADYNEMEMTEEEQVTE